jgi:hypothetical protein
MLPVLSFFKLVCAGMHIGTLGTQMSPHLIVYFMWLRLKLSVCIPANIFLEKKCCMELYVHSPICLQIVMCLSDYRQVLD